MNTIKNLFSAMLLGVNTIKNLFSAMFLMGVAGLAMLGVGLSIERADAAPTPTPLVNPCSAQGLKGTYSFLTTGFGPVPPQTVLATPVAIAGAPGGLLPLHAIGHVRMKANGESEGYIHENVGGALEELVPFEGRVYDFRVGPHGEGCWAKWELQDRHHLPIFANEPPHFFRIAIGKDRFEFMTFGGGPGPATLSGFATKTQF